MAANAFSLGGLPGVPSPAVGQPSGLTEMGSALGALPQTIDQAQIQRMQAQAQKQELAKQLLATIASRAQQDPASQSNPQLTRQADRITRESGMAPVTQQNMGGSGESLNMNALIPKKHLSDLDDKTRLDLLGREPAARKAVAASLNIDVDDPSAQSFFSMPQDVSLNPNMVESAQRGAEATLFKWQSGLLTPQAYVSFINANERALGADYVRNMTDPAMVEAGISKRADALIAAIPAGIAVRMDANKLRERAIQNQQDEFNKLLPTRLAVGAATVAKDRADVTVDSARAISLIAGAKRASAEADAVSQKLGPQLQLIQAQIGKTTLTNRSVTAQLGEKLSKDAIDGQAKLDTLNAQIGNLLYANGANMDDPQIQAMMAQREKLQGLVNNAIAAAGEAKIAGANAAGAAVQAVTGHTAQTAGGGAPVMQGQSKSGKPIYSTDGGKSWNYGTGP